MQTVLFRPPPTPAPPAPPSLPRGLWMLLQEKEPPLVHRSIFTPSFSRSVHPPPQSLGQGSKLPLQHPLGPWPCAQNCRGSVAARDRRQNGRGPPPPRSLHLGGGPVACFPEFLTHVGLNTICEAVMWDVTTFQKTELSIFFLQFFLCLHESFLLFCERLLCARR